MTEANGEGMNGAEANGEGMNGAEANGEGMDDAETVSSPDYEAPGRPQTVTTSTK